jgi:hypothetical protein
VGLEPTTLRLTWALAASFDCSSNWLYAAVYGFSAQGTKAVMGGGHHMRCWIAAAVCPMLIAIGIWGAGHAGARGTSWPTRCVDKGVRPLPLLRGHLTLNRSPDFSFPELLIHYRTPAFPKECERRYRRSVAVSVGVKFKGRPGIVPIVGGTKRPVEWVTILRGFEAEGPEWVGAISGQDFAEEFPCAERLVGHTRYRVMAKTGTLLRERIFPYRPSFGRCGAATSQAADVEKVRVIHA